MRTNTIYVIIIKQKAGNFAYYEYILRIYGHIDVLVNYNKTNGVKFKKIIYCSRHIPRIIYFTT